MLKYNFHYVAMSMNTSRILKSVDFTKRQKSTYRERNLWHFFLGEREILPTLPPWKIVLRGIQQLNLYERFFNGKNAWGLQSNIQLLYILYMLTILTNWLTVSRANHEYTRNETSTSTWQEFLILMEWTFCGNTKYHNCDIY